MKNNLNGDKNTDRFTDDLFVVEKKKKDLPKSQVKETKKNVQESYSSMSNFLDTLN